MAKLKLKNFCCTIDTSNSKDSSVNGELTAGRGIEQSDSIKYRFLRRDLGGMNVSDKNHRNLRIPPEMPDDMIFEILLKLPTESICRCRSVCKSWLKIIETPTFIKAQVENTTRVKSIDNCFIVIPDRYDSANTLYSVAFRFSKGSKANSVGDLDYPTRDGFHFSKKSWAGGDVGELEYPTRDCKRDVKLVGTCNGLICLENLFSQRPDGTIRSYTLWNPSTGIYRVMDDECMYLTKEWAINGMNCCESHIYFGYDPVKDDYHVVRVNMNHVKPSGKHHGFALFVYSLRNSSWTVIYNEDGLQHDWNVNMRSGVFIAGTVYLMSKRIGNDGPPFYPMIVALNVSTKSCFLLVELPPNHHVVRFITDYNKLILSEWCGRLIMLDTRWLSNAKNGVWLMKDDDHGGGIIKQSWSLKTEINTSKTVVMTKFWSVMKPEVPMKKLYDKNMKSFEWFDCGFECDGQNKEILVPIKWRCLDKIHACVCLRTLASPFVFVV